MKLTNRLPVTDEDCFYLEHLEMTRGVDIGITDDDLAYVLEDCPNLASAQLSGIPDLTDRTLNVLAYTAMNLRRLDVSGCVEVSDVGVLELAANATRLQVLKLNGVSGLMDPSISTLARSLPHLTELELCDLPLLTAVSVRDIWTFSRKIRRLKLAHCPQLNDRAFPSPPNLASYEPVPPCADDHGVQRQLRPPTWLDTLPPLVLAASQSFSDLHFLDLSYCAKVTDVAIAGIVAYAQRIRHLNLSGCVALTDNAAESVCALGTHLHVLTLAHVELLTDYGIVHIATACTQLKSVDVSRNRRLTDLSLLELVALPHLHRLSAEGLPRLTDVAVLFLAEHASVLERLHLSYCRRISLHAVHVLLRKVSTLEHLSMSGVSSFRRTGVARFSERAPEGYDERREGIFRVFRGQNVHALRDFLDKELTRLREAERRNILFTPRADDSEDLY
ncbi:RNI-like protein [Amylocystis lapponica]|nr:RNI-like protein [Amylocystis lapponica]